jgi:hypothetical protein
MVDRDSQTGNPRGSQASVRTFFFADCLALVRCLVETVSNRNPGGGFHGIAVLGGGNWNTETGFAGGSYSDGRDIFGLSARRW